MDQEIVERIRQKLMTGKIKGHYLFPLNEGRLNFIKDVIDYRLYSGSYRHIISSGGYIYELTDGLEMAKVWHETSELPKLGTFGNNEMTFYGGKYQLQEITNPKTSINCGEYTNSMSYAIYVSEAGKIVRVEQWRGEEDKRVYMLGEKEVPISAMRAKDESS